jgi:hypothetical protein
MSQIILQLRAWYHTALNCLHTDFPKEAYAENLAKIASELSVLEPI